MSPTTGPHAAGQDFVISRILTAPRERVFEAFTKPALLCAWWGPAALDNVDCSVDLRPGGGYRIVLRGADGAHYPVKGEYREIAAPSRLVMTLDCSEHPPSWHQQIDPVHGNRPDTGGPPRLVALQTVTFDDHDGKTLLTLRLRFDHAQLRNAMVDAGLNEGWSESLERLMHLLTPA